MMKHILMFLLFAVVNGVANAIYRGLDPWTENQTLLITEWHHPVSSVLFHVHHVEHGNIFNSYDNYTDSRYTLLWTIGNLQTYRLRVAVNGSPTVDIAGRYVVETDTGQVIDTVDVEILHQQSQSFTADTMSTTSVGTMPSTASTNTDLPSNTTSTFTVALKSTAVYIAALFVAIAIQIVCICIPSAPNSDRTPNYYMYMHN